MSDKDRPIKLKREFLDHHGLPKSEVEEVFEQRKHERYPAADFGSNVLFKAFGPGVISETSQAAQTEVNKVERPPFQLPLQSLEAPAELPVDVEDSETEDPQVSEARSYVDQLWEEMDEAA